MNRSPIHVFQGVTIGRRLRDTCDGVALFVVLAILVLISVLVVAFFSSVSTQVTSARNYASGATVKQLADSAVQLVVAQIADATSGTSAAAGTVAWASQPGMIRIYDTSGNPASYFKLYSTSLPLAISGSDLNSFTTGGDMPAAGWNDPSNGAYKNSQGLYTDINSPVTHDGNTYFPIIDGNGMQSITVSGSQVLTYTGTGGNPAVEGFGVNPSQVSYNPGQLPSGTNNPVPMPVKWLYVLQDGKIASPATDTNGVITFDSKYNVPSGTNPIVGRIAFWTDDETCKVNINTASEGTFWDRPWANTITEQNYSMAIPAQNEFQRYPGHPAKTCLSTIFGSVLPSPVLSPAWYYGISGAQQTTNQDELKKYYDLIPRVSDGGTRGGNVNEMTISGGTNSQFSSITPDADRLYASTDEFIYNTLLSGSSREQNDPVITNSLLEKVKFFATAHNSAPELNLFGKPRMTLWPIQMSTAARNAKDKLIAFCSTIGGKEYYFQRYSTYTRPSSIGAGSPSSSSQSATLDWTGVLRNQQLYTYLDGLMQQPIPGFGGNFRNKYPNTRQQILTEMFDMIRSGVNTYSNGLSPNYDYAPTYLDPGEGQIVPLIPPPNTPGAGTHGFGRFVTITGAAINFFRSNGACYTTSGTPASSSPVNVDPSYVDAQVNPNGVVISPGPQIGATLILDPFTTAPGFPPWSPNVQYVITGLDQFKISNQSLNFPHVLKNTVTSRAECSGLWNCSPFFNIIPSFRYGATISGTNSTDGTKTAGFANPITQYPFSVPTSSSSSGSPPTSGVTLPATAKTFDFTGGTITIDIYSGSDGDPTSPSNMPSTPIQSISLFFQDVKGLRVPTTAPTWASSVQATAPGTTFNARIGDGTATALQKPWRLRMINFTPIPATNPPFPNVLQALGNGKDTTGNPVNYWSEDVARGVEADAGAQARGDYRLYAGLSTVPSTYFKICQNYDYPQGGPQQYSNVQTLRDEGVDGGGAGGFGYDSNMPGGLYTHYPNNAAGVSNARSIIAISTISSGVLIPSGSLAPYTGQDGNGSHTGDLEYRSTAHPAVPNGLTGATLTNGNFGDWDNATGQIMDGPFINKPDEGNSSTVSYSFAKTNVAVYTGTSDISGGYFSFGFGVNDYQSESGATFSPNRQIASAVMFGSLPTGLDPTGHTASPWQTLLFCANPEANSSPGAIAGASHPGFGVSVAGGGDSGPPYNNNSPPDHLLLDLFTMPIVEPYAISEPFATAGKVNMNYQMVPFTYIRRDTGIRAVLKSTRIMAIPQRVSTVSGGISSYKDGQRCNYEMRYNVNPDETVGTLAGFENRFNKNDIFRSASEMCSIFLVPQLIPILSQNVSYPPTISTPPISYAATASWWNNFLLTGDNTREGPYNDIYPRLTTKSNTYTVHMKVQTLKKVPGTPANQWVENRDQVTGEYRGSQTVERYIDLNDPNVATTDFAASGAPSAESFYKIRLLNSTTFTP